MSPPDSTGDLHDALIEPRANDRWPRGVTCEGGFRLLGTPLGFAGSSNSGLLFYADIDQRPPAAGKRILCTTAAATAIGAQRRGLDVLGLDPDRKVRLGRMDLRLLPSGLGFGAALLEVVYRSRSIVYCSGVRTARPLHCAPVEIPRCDLLLLDTPFADKRPPSPRTAARALVSWVEEHLRGKVVVIACGSNSAAVDVAWALAPLRVRTTAWRPLYELLRRTEIVDRPRTRLQRLDRTWPEDGVVLCPHHLWPTSPFSRGVDEVAYAGPGRAAPPWARASFCLAEREDRSGLLAFIRRTGAAQVALGPRCDDALAAFLRKSGVNVLKLVAPTQIPLPI